MTDQSPILAPMTLQDSSASISSPVSEHGILSSPLQSGEIDLFGQEVAPVSHSRSRARAKALPTNETYGRNSNGSSRSECLQSLLESNLRTQLNGSPVCEVIWKPWVTPWGQCLSRPRARVRTITETDISLWPTMTSNAPARNGNNEAGNSSGQVAIRKILLGLWSTCRASDGAKGGPKMSFGTGGVPLPAQVSAIANSSNAPTENGGRSLHPEFAGWELGFPPAWLNCAPSATRSIGARPQNSSKPSRSAAHD